MDSRLTKQTFKIYWKHAKKYPWTIFFMFSGMVLAVVCGLITPFLYKNFLNLVATGNLNAAPQLLRIIIQVLALNILVWVGWRIGTFANNNFEPNVMADLQETCFSYLQNHSYNFFNNNFAGSLVRRVNKYARSFEDIADVLFWEMSNTFLRVIIIISVLLWKYQTLGLIMLGWCVIYIGFNYRFSLFKLKYDIERAALDTKLTGHLADTITNNMNIKLFGGFEREKKSFRKILTDWLKAQVYSWNLGMFSESIQAALGVLLEFAIFYYGIRYWRAGSITLGDFVVFQIYIIVLIDHLWQFGRNIRKLYEAISEAEEMTEILLTKHEIKDLPGAKELKVRHGEIEFKNVTFSYHKSINILKEFNLKIKAGERIALIGPSGGGKSTIVRLIFRFFDLTDGEITIDGQNIKNVSQESLRDNLSLVPQDPILFHRTLMENIRYSKPEATDAEVINAAKLAHCHEFILKFPAKYETYVGERGVKLSGGERQRVAIARAILKNAPILLLDEATSSLDSESEMLIQDALKNLMRDKTTIVVAHRLSTIMQMDRIIVIDKGAIAEEGKHKELLKVKQGIYQKLWGIQAGGFSSSET